MTISATAPALPIHPSNELPAAGRRGRGPAGIAVRATTTLAAAGLLLAATACSSGDGAAAPRPDHGAAHDRRAAGDHGRAGDHGAPPADHRRPPNPARPRLLDGILESHHAAGEFVGARIALRDRDGTVTEVTAGTPTVDPASGPVDPDVPWNIGSATKTFVAVVVLQLADEGRIDLDAGIERYLPDLPGADRITPRQLLQHTSGLGEYLDEPGGAE